VNIEAIIRRLEALEETVLTYMIMKRWYSR
jgi:hypothetical protein